MAELLQGCIVLRTRIEPVTDGWLYDIAEVHLKNFYYLQSTALAHELLRGAIIDHKATNIFYSVYKNRLIVSILSKLECKHHTALTMTSKSYKTRNSMQKYM